MPTQPAQQIVARALICPATADDGRPANSPARKGFLTSLVYPAHDARARTEPSSGKFNFFAGPKEYRTLAHIAERFQNNVDLVMGFGFFGFFSKALLLGMNWLHHTLSISATAGPSSSSRSSSKSCSGR